IYLISSVYTVSISFSACSLAKASARSFSTIFLAVSTKIGDEINKDEYVPTPIPNNISNTNPLMDSPQKINIISKTTIIVADVLNVRDKVVFIEWLTTSSKLPSVRPLTNSLTRSKTITVSFNEYPITVSKAATKD